MPRIPATSSNGRTTADNSPIPGVISGRANTAKPSRSRGSRVSRDFKEYTGVASKLATFLSDYIVLSSDYIVVVSAWVVAAHLADQWDRFPHLAVTSPEKRCGKTRLLQLLELVTPDAYNTSNISPAALYRLVEQKQPTLLLDEAQSISRRGSESSEVIRELFNAGIDRNSRVIRCGGKNMDEIKEFAIYSPKVIALIGDLDGVLADRCLPIEMMRKTQDDSVLPYRSRIVEPRGKELHDVITSWADDNRDKVTKVYDALEPFPIENDRMAELLLPTQAVLEVSGPAEYLETLGEYAAALDKRDRETESPGVRLLAACQEIFNSCSFMPTDTLINVLVDRREEPWHRWNRGQPSTRESLANLLRPYKIRPDRTQKKVGGKVKTTRGYCKNDFEDAWTRYL